MDFSLFLRANTGGEARRFLIIPARYEEGVGSGV
jgi:hypothetical protein